MSGNANTVTQHRIPQDPNPLTLEFLSHKFHYQYLMFVDVATCNTPLPTSWRFKSWLRNHI